jgi:transposase-like protein
VGETRRKFDADFKEGAVRLVRETGKPIAQVAREPGASEGTLGNWVTAAPAAPGGRGRRAGRGRAGGAGAAAPQVRGAGDAL